MLNGGDEENRTPDPLLARQVLSQLSYAPICLSFCHITLLLFLAFGRRMFLYVSVRLVIAPSTVPKILRNNAKRFVAPSLAAKSHRITPL